MGMKVKDIAEKLELSPSTVSLVLNNKPGISEDTRNRVLNAVKEMGFGDLLEKRTTARKSLQFIVFRKSSDFSSDSSFFPQVFSQIIEGVDTQVKARGYSLMVAYMDENDILQQLEQLKLNQCEGMLLLATDMTPEQLKLLKSARLPIVILDNYFETESFDCVTINNEQGVFQAVRYLADMGHEKIGYLHSGVSVNNFSERYYAFLRAMEKCGLPIEKRYFCGISATESEARQNVTSFLQENKNLPTAFFADNDVIAIYAMKVMQELGYRIPEDISIVGFDNMPVSEMLNPPLTSIHVAKQSLGKLAVNRLIDKITSDCEETVKIEIATKLIKRKSVKNLNT